jgi:hypothetical protein
LLGTPTWPPCLCHFIPLGMSENALYDFPTDTICHSPSQHVTHVFKTSLGTHNLLKFIDLRSSLQRRTQIQNFNRKLLKTLMFWNVEQISYDSGKIRSRTRTVTVPYFVATVTMLCDWMRRMKTVSTLRHKNSTVKVRIHDAALYSTLSTMTKLLRVSTSEIIARNVAGNVAEVGSSCPSATSCAIMQRVYAR